MSNIDNIRIEVSQSENDDIINVKLEEIELFPTITEDIFEITLESCDNCAGGSSSDITSSEEYDSDGTLIENDIVFLSDINEHYVIKIIDNNSINPAIGIVTSILSGNKVKVSNFGYFDIGNNLVSGKKLYISPVGEFTTILPDDNYIQVMGVAISNNRIFLNPQFQRTKRFNI